MMSRQAKPPPPAAAEKGEETNGDFQPQPRRDGDVLGPTGATGRSSGRRVISLVVRLVAGALIIAVALGIAGLLISNRHQALRAPIHETVRRVRVVEAVEQPSEAVSRAWEGFGTARAKAAAEVSAEVSGRIVQRPRRIDPGVAVEAGELLVQLDEADYQERMLAAQSAARSLTAQLEGLDIEQGAMRAQLAEAEQQVELAQWELDRVQEARAGSAASDVELVRLRGNLSRLESERSRLQQQVDLVPTRRAALQAELTARQNEAAMAERQLLRTRVVSPIGGILQSIDANIGEMVQAGQRISRVVDVSRIEIPLRVPASAQAEIRTGGEATVRSTATGSASARQWQARIARLAPEADPQTRMITVFLEVDQDLPTGAEDDAWANLLMPGRFVTAELRGRGRADESLILVPRRAVAGDRVWVAVRDAEGAMRAQPRQVQVRYFVAGSFPALDGNETQWAVIGAGLQAGEQVIVTNLDELVAGVRVEVVQEEVNREERRENGAAR